MKGIFSAGRPGRIWSPEVFQGAGRHGRYFEGWYVKLVSADERFRYAVIPGVSLPAEKKDRHAFIQLLDGRTGASSYHRFPISEFAFDPYRFRVVIAGNEFSLEGVTLSLPGVSAAVRFKNPVRLRSPFFSPGVMGWFAFVPFMECYHGLVSMEHGLDGGLEAGGERMDFSGGYGYIEKDWGRSFPSDYIWMQTNHFHRDGRKVKGSFMFSVARIPWLGAAFTGFLSVLWDGNSIRRFATYTGARLEELDVSGNRLSLKVRERGVVLDIEASRSEGPVLRSPVEGAMEGKIRESLDASVRLKFSDGKGKVLFEGVGTSAGLEITGDPGRFGIPRRSRI